jgi:hypothetical protein
VAQPEPNRDSKPDLLITPSAETRALAPVYDYIRSLVAKWEAERTSGREEQPS